MKLHSPMAAKKLWNLLRIAFFMSRKGLISKTKLSMDLNLMMKRGKFIGKNLANFMFHYHHHSSSMTAPPLSPAIGLGEYEFSCSNTPNPISLHGSTKRHHNYFPCINSTPTIDELEETRGPAIVLPMIEYSPQCAFGWSDLNPGERRSPMIPSPFSARMPNYSLEDEGGSCGRQVDKEAEEFIKRFYEHLRVQSSPVALLQN